MSRLNVIGGFAGATSIVSGSSEPEYFGASMVFAQSVAPTGWVKLTTYDDYSLRIVSGTGGVASSANQPFTTVFTTNMTSFPPETGSWPLGSTDVTTVSTAMMETHQHAGDSGAGAGISGYTTGWPGSGPGTPYLGIVNPVNPFVNVAGGSTGAGGGHSHASAVLTTISYSSSFNFNIKYRDVLVAKYH